MKLRLMVRLSNQPVVFQALSHGEEIPERSIFHEVWVDIPDPPTEFFVEGGKQAPAYTLRSVHLLRDATKEG